LEKKNILHLVGSFHQGGSERQAVQLIKLLCRRGDHNIFVASLNGDGSLRPEVEDIGFVDIPEFPLTSFYDRNMLRQMSAFVKFTRANKISVLQTHDFYTNVFGMLAGSIARVPARIAAKRETGMRTSAQRATERQALRLAHRVVVNAEAVKNHLVDSGVSAKKIEVIYNGLDLGKFDSGVADRRASLRKLGLPESENNQYVTILANLRSPVKNHRMFIRAASRIRESIPDANFVLAGEGELISEVRAFASEMGLNGNAFFTGRCANVPELLSVSDVCVLSSDSEGFSNSILEYMAAAKPVVATNVGGAGESIVDGETGYLVEPNDHEAMAKFVVDLLKDKKTAAEIGRRGRERAEQNFSLERQLNATLELYDRLSG